MNAKAQMIAKDALMTMVNDIQEKRAFLSSLEKKVENAKKLVEEAQALRQKALEDINESYSHLVAEVGEDLAKLLDGGNKPAKANTDGSSGGKDGKTRTRMTEEQKAKLQADVEAVMAKASTKEKAVKMPEITAQLPDYSLVQVRTALKELKGLKQQGLLKKTVYWLPK